MGLTLNLSDPNSLELANTLAQYGVGPLAIRNPAGRERGPVVTLELSDITMPVATVAGPARCERKRAPR